MSQLENMKTMWGYMDNKSTKKIWNHIKMRETHKKTESLRNSSMVKETNVIKKAIKKPMMKAKTH